jgi:hypothetical protein
VILRDLGGGSSFCLKHETQLPATACQFISWKPSFSGL